MKIMNMDRSEPYHAYFNKTLKTREHGKKIRLNTIIKQWQMMRMLSMINNNDELANHDEHDEHDKPDE